MRLSALVVAVVSILVAQGPARAVEAEEAMWVGLLDTLGPLAEGSTCEGLKTREGWQQVPEDETNHRFQGDVVLANRGIAVVLRKGGPGAEVYSLAREGWTRRAVLVPCGQQPAKDLASVKALVVDGEAVAVEATFRAEGGRTLGLVCELGAARTFVRTEARGETRRLRVQAEGRFGLVPDFYADDITLDAAKIPVAQAHIPTENMFAEALAGGQAMALALWDGPPQDIEITLAGDGDRRTISAAEVGYAPKGKIYFALLDFPGACCAALLDGLPERSEPIAGFKLAAPVRRLDWRMPFPAQWRVDYVSEKDDPKWARSREMSAPYPYPVKDGKCREFRFIKPTYVWDWGGGTDGERAANPDKYPSWIDFEGRGHVRPGGGSYAAIVYPFDRGRGTPLEAVTLTDLVRQTLGVGPCQYILDADRRITQTPGIFTCGGTSLLKKLEGSISKHKPEAEKLMGDMLVFVRAYRKRIDQYMAFKRDLLIYLDDQQAKHPEQKDFIGRMKSLLEGIPSEPPQDFPKVIEGLNVEYRATLDSDDEAAKKTREQLHKRYTGAGGAQDGIVARCHQTAKLLRYRAGLTLTADPTTAAIAREVRTRASSVLHNPMYHETKDRHQ
jgi:hypothetical protein